MEKIVIGTEVKVALKSMDAANLGINGSYFGNGKIVGHYPLGHYVERPDKKPNTVTKMAIADKYNALTPV